MSKILIIDDSEFNLFAMQSVLTGMFELNSDTVDSGEKALELIKSRESKGQVPYTLILLDFFMMPGWNGPETANQIKDYFRNESLNRPPFILVQSEIEDSHYRAHIDNKNIDKWSFRKPMPNNELEIVLR